MVFPHARFIQVADNAGELIDNRRGAPEMLATPALALAAIVEAIGNRAPAADRAWAEGLRRKHLDRSAPEKRSNAPMTGSDGKVHPNAIFEAIREVADPDHIAIAGEERPALLRAGRAGGEDLSRRRRRRLPRGGVPYGVAAALAFPGRQVISVNGDGAFGLNAMEIDTAVRHGAKAGFTVSNNAFWSIERYDQGRTMAGASSARCCATPITPGWPAR